jgi:hypothetical protein
MILISILLNSYSNIYPQVIKNNKKLNLPTETNTTNEPLLKIEKDTISINPNVLKDTTQKSRVDSVKRLFAKSIRKSNSDIDSAVTYSAKDSMVFNVKTKTMRLRGSAKVDFKAQKSEAEVIIIDFNKSIMELEGVKDSSKKIIGYPKITDKGEAYVGEKIKFNFKTQQGTISLGETEVSEGYYFGKKIKRVSDDELFIQDGCYTTCNKAHPHYYFGSPEMKVIANEKVFIDPLIFYVEDLPIFMLPIGLFFPSKGGRQSGLMVPTMAVSKSRGVAIQDLGLYLALSDYYDTQFKLDFFSKGGFVLKNNTRWKLRDVFDGNFDVEYGKTRFNPNDEYAQNQKYIFNHRHELSPNTRFDARVQFYSQDYNRNTSFNLQERMRQNVTSNASFSKTFDNGQSFSISFNRDQNIITNEVRQTLPSISYSIPQLYLLKGLISPQSSLPQWLRDVSFQYSVSSRYYDEKLLSYKNIPITDSTSKIDTSFVKKYQSSISHSPRLSISPKFGFFTFTPSINFNANNYFRRVDRTYSDADSTTHDKVETGVFTEYWYSTGFNVSTKLFGTMQPKILGVNAVRHIFQPSVGFSYTPDFSNKSLGMYSKYYDSKRKDSVKYSRYELDGGGSAPSYLSKSMNYSIQNTFQAKIAQGDTIPDKNIDFFIWSLAGSCNFAADSLKFSDVGMNFRIPTLSDINLTASANFTLYDFDKIQNPDNQTYSYHKVNRFLAKSGKGLLRLTDISLQMNTTITSKGVSFSPEAGKDISPKKDSIGLGERFKERMEYEDKPFDFFGDNSPGYTPVTIPWNLNLGLNFQYSEPAPFQISRRINLNTGFSFSLTPTWSINGNAQYDFVGKELIAPALTITKDMHCWVLDFQWYPIGYSQGFYLKFAIKTPQLSGLKLDWRNSPLLR